MIKFKINETLMYTLIIVLIFYTLVEGVLSLMSPSDFKLVRETNSVLVIREVRNHGWNVSDPITLYKIPAACNEPPHAMDCYFLTQEDGHRYEYVSLWNEHAYLLENLNKIERIRRQQQQQR